jgi:hypothetical protein
MMIVALISDNVVSSIVTVESDEEFQVKTHGYSNAIDITDANPQPVVGWVFDGNHLSPGPGQGATATRKITKLGLRQRFTFSELCALTAAAQTTTPVAALLGNLSVATYVDLNRADTAGGIGLLVSIGLLTPERATAILTAPIQELEKYKGTD